MSTYIEFEILKRLNDDFLRNIKIISVFGHKMSEVLIVTKDDTVFGFGENDWGVLGLGDNRQVYEPKIVQELSGKGLIRFINGSYHVIGLTNDGKIYTWGRNDYSQLGNGTINSHCNKPEVNLHLINEVIIDVNCGESHSLVLTNKSELYVWGYNYSGQIGNKKEKLFQKTPFNLKAFNDERIVKISCGFSHSLALTDKGHVFSWGINDRGQLGIEGNDGTYNRFKPIDLKSNKPKLVKVKNDNKTDVYIEKICCGSNHTMLLSSEGVIYTFGQNIFGQIGNNSFIDQMTPHQINSLVKYKDIASHFLYDISIALSVDNLFYIWGKVGDNKEKTPKKFYFESFDDIFLTYHHITHNSYKFSCDFNTIINSSLDNEEFENKKINKTNNETVQIKDYLNHISLLFSPNIIAKYRKQTQIEANFDLDMKISYHFDDRDSERPYDVVGRNSFFVTEDNKVYGVGNNSSGLLGFGHKNEINELIIVNELCDKGIIEFANGAHHVMARTDGNKLYIWGYNSVGQLGNETYHHCFVPKLVESVDSISYICCGFWHSLALTKNGEVYAWGKNNFGQTGSGSYEIDQLTPFKIEKFSDKKVIAIACGGLHSLALTDNGDVYGWGRNDCGQLGFANTLGSNKPKRIKLNNNKSKLEIRKISCGYSYSLLLTSEGDIYGFGSNDFGQLANACFKNYFIPTKILHKIKFIDIASHYICSLSTALSVDGLYYIWGDNGYDVITEPIVTQIDSFNKIFLKFYDISYGRIETEIKYPIISQFSIEENSYYKRYFEESCIIDFGSFGIVSKAKNKKENEFCAIKRIALNDKNKDSVFKEFEIMSQLKSDFVVKVGSVWFENNYLLKDGFEKFKNYGLDSISGHRLFDSKNNLLLHIQMELCFKSLKEIRKMINNELNSYNEEIMTQIHYYILSELFIEILESVNYLHKQNPPIIHRDIKPANILITHGKNGRFVKLCDFGLAKLHEFDGQSHSFVGSLKYIAPEIYGKYYNTKVDVYSLGVVFEELIEGLKDQMTAQPEMTCFPKYKYLHDLVEFNMKEKDQELRPNCELILYQKNEWAISISDIVNDTFLQEILDNTFSIEDKFHLFFIKKKLQISNQSNHSKTKLLQMNSKRESEPKR